MVEIYRILILGEAGGVEHLGELGCFLRDVIVFARDGVEVEGFEEGPFFVW